jgi:WD40 repeat protein/tRNA A-37 threonylcarbamoyl transferase component Bud32
MPRGRDTLLESTRIARNVDEACDRFEFAWRAGDRPQIEAFLGGTSQENRPGLLRHLLEVEIEYRAEIGESAHLSEYRHRFPGYESLVDSVFAEFLRQSQIDRPSELESSIARRWDSPSSVDAVSSAPSVFPDISGSQILSELGRGGMGIVYKARQIRLNRLCAVKITLPGKHNCTEFRTRFLAEAETIARLRHPNIVQIYGMGEHDGRPYFEMEYIEGGSLAQRLDGTPWAPEIAARFVAVLARAIGDAHRLGIIHRDLKPANILLLDADTPKIVDFGLAKTLETDSNLTQSGVFIGTPSYAAPEQVEGLAKAIGPATDIYALGVIYYQMLTGRPPFQAATVLQTLEQVRAADPVPPSRLQPGLSQDAETICLKCLQKDPRRRYVDALALAEDLDRFLTGRAILARPTGAAERFRKWMVRRPAVAMLSMSVAAVTILGFILVSWQWRRAEAKARAEVAANKLAQQARLMALEKEAELMFQQGMALCEQGEVPRGLLWLSRALELANEARSESLDRPLRINLADWAGQLSRRRRLPPMRHSGPVMSLNFRRGGGALVSVGEEGVARIWDTTTGHQLEPPLKLKEDTSEPRRLESARFGPGQSGLLEAVDHEGNATLWDVNNRRPLAGSLASTDGQHARDTNFPDLHSLITSDRDPIETRCDKRTRRPPECGGSPEQRRGKTTWALSPDGRTLVTANRDRQVIRWNLATRRPVGPELHLDTPVEAIALTPDGRKVITGGRSGKLYLWDVETERGFELPPQGTKVTCLAVSPDGRVFASGTEGGVVRLWDACLLGQIGQTCKVAGAVTALAFAPDGRDLAMGGDEGTIRLWEVPHRKALCVPLRLNHPVQTVTFAEDGRRLLIGSSESAHWWDLTSPMIGESGQSGDDRLIEGTSSRVEASAVSPDGATLATARSEAVKGGTRGRVELRDAATGRWLRQTPDHPHAISGVAFSADSKWLLTWGPGPGTARLWDVSTLHGFRPLFQSLQRTINQGIFSPDGRTLLLGCRDGKARLWDVEKDVEINPEHCPRHAYPITAVAFDPSRSRVVTGCHAGTVRVWDATRGTLLSELRLNAGEIVVLAFSPDGKTLLTASCDGTARFLDAESGVQLGPTLHHTDAVLCAAFHPDGHSVVTGTRDGMVERWSQPSPPKVGAAAEIRQWLNQETGMELGDQGATTSRSVDD